MTKITKIDIYDQKGWKTASFGVAHNYKAYILLCIPLLGRVVAFFRGAFFSYDVHCYFCFCRYETARAINQSISY